jgi:phosphohistidine phosphatase SixA
MFDSEKDNPMKKSFFLKKYNVVPWIILLTLPAQVEPQSKDTVIYLVRHAEKTDDSRDPPLSGLGFKRAKLLAQMLRDTELTHVHSTDLERTRDTAAPIALQSGLDVQIYDPEYLKEFAILLSATPGRHLVVGHSDTTPKLVRFLGGESSDISDHEYDRLYVLTLESNDDTTTLLIRFGSSLTGS